ncbi:universal stress protein [Daejeonella oryzae]|uniref:universal stress protein n=1 Tax=Daejeonella oryzae TaxID=1122943 RepID=UPI00047C597A|nr:universal stress protein [Daejeonella oryzae]
MKNILITTDFSICAANAVDFAVQSAKYLKSNLILIHSFESSGSLYTDYQGVNTEFNQSLFLQAEQKLNDLKKEILQQDGISVEGYVYKGSLNEALTQAVTEKNIDLIIMGTSGASGIKEKFRGSKTADVMGKCKIPVMAIPIEYKWKKPEKILMAINNLLDEEIKLDFLFEIALFFEAQVEVAVFTDDEKDTAITYLENTRKIPRYERMLKEQYHAETLTVTHFFGHEFEKTMKDYIGQNEIDILAMIIHKRKFPDSLFHPSLTKQMAYHTKIPLLSIPAN